MQRADYKREFKRLLKALEQYFNKRSIKPKRSKAYIDDVELLKNYVEVKLKLGRVPREVDMGKLGRYARNNYRNHFGSFDQFLAILGEVTPPRDATNRALDFDKQSKHVEIRKVPTVMGLIKEFHRLRRELGRPVTPRDIEEKSIYSLKEFENVFKTFDRLNALE